jgi:sulfhydrogenase subunit alpha
VQISPAIRRLRRLLYCGEWIESHALHVYLLNAPDFLGFESGLEMAERFPNEVNRGLRMRKLGNRLLDVLGGRAIHPVNVTVGGFFRAPPVEAMQQLIPEFEWAVQAAIDTTHWVAGFDFPDFACDYELVSLVHPDEYPMNEGALAGSSGWTAPVSGFETEFGEQQVPHSTALHCVRAGTGRCYLVGPLARVALNREKLSPTARRVADDLRLTWPCCNPFQSIVARGLELIHAFEEALAILKSYEPAKPPRIRYEHRAGEGCAATEAPRGLLYHRYRVDEGGHVCEARIVPPTSQNQGQIEADLRAWLPAILSEPDDVVARRSENLVRCYDPCISCSTHFLHVVIERG